MVSIIVSFLAALLVSLIITPLVRKISLRRGLVDEPGGRRMQEEPVPRTGGVAILVAFIAPLAAVYIFQTAVGLRFYKDTMMATGIIAGSIIISLLGLADDVWGLGAKKKLLVQTLVAIGCYLIGFRIESVFLPFVGRLEMGVFGVIITIVWIVGIINAFNLIDGLDGLAAGVGFVALATNFVLGFSGDRLVLCLLVAALAGALIGFLRYNFNPATIFMGDSGSMLIGFVLATTSLMSNQKSSTMIAILVPIIAMGLPIMDTLFAIVRRFLERRPLFSPDRGHFHHRLIALGFTQKRAVLTLYVVSICLAAIALAIHFGRDWQKGLGLALMGIVVIVFTRIVWMIRRSHASAAAGSRHRDSMTEVIKSGLYEEMKRLEQVQEADGLKKEIDAFAKHMDIRTVRIEDADGKSVLFEHINPEYGIPARTSPVLIEYVIERAETGKIRLTFEWYAEYHNPSAQTDILLQMWVDVFEKKLHLLLQAGPNPPPSPFGLRRAGKP